MCSLEQRLPIKTHSGRLLEGNDLGKPTVSGEPLRANFDVFTTLDQENECEGNCEPNFIFNQTIDFSN